MRTVPEWIAKHDDAPIPKAVRARVFNKHHGRCHISGRPIRGGEKWECDHVVALCNGGEHRENNLAPALVDKHKEKTRSDRRIKAKNDRVRKKHIMGRQSRNPLPCGKNSPFKKKIGTGEVVRR